MLAELLETPTMKLVGLNALFLHLYAASTLHPSLFSDMSAVGTQEQMLQHLERGKTLAIAFAKENPKAKQRVASWYDFLILEFRWAMALPGATELSVDQALDNLDQSMTLTSIPLPANGNYSRPKLLEICGSLAYENGLTQGMTWSITTLTTSVFAWV